ncbi:hypothetical protein QBC37DRAFT_294884 [Rhypophila decipiens]|uniref:Uncharacterized protein n=1 Tax=Rhypophila decipiens TaxID=261697 RepID=A0AAN6Y371_9PEZI|nr:hypothetical protein QBC37DRAFT_294884 [Rhypophila decipiens]
MVILRTLALGLLLVVSTSAFNWTDLEPPGLAPNETRFIAFKPYPEDPEYKSTEWTWRVNITDIPAPDEETNYPLGKPSARSPDTRALLVTYDLSWPGGGLLQDTVSNDAPGFCVTYPYTIGSMPNVTNKWPEANTDSPDCAPVLGQACVDAIVKMAAKPDPTRDSCEVHRSWWTLPECESSFGYHNRHRESPFGFYYNLASGMDPNPGKAFNWIGYTYDGANNQSIYESAVIMLQIVMFHSTAPRSGWLNQSDPKPRKPMLACMRVKTDKLSEEIYQRIADGNSGYRNGVDVGMTLGVLGLAIVVAWAL